MRKLMRFLIAVSMKNGEGKNSKSSSNSSSKGVGIPNESEEFSTNFYH